MKNWLQDKKVKLVLRYLVLVLVIGKIAMLFGVKVLVIGLLAAGVTYWWA